MEEADSYQVQDIHKAFSYTLSIMYQGQINDIDNTAPIL